MLQLPRTEMYFLTAITLLTAALAVKLFSTGLFRTYRAFTTFLVISVLRVAVMATVTLSPTRYRDFFIATESLHLILYVWIVMELYSLTFRKYDGIRTASQLAMGGALLVSLVLSFLSLSTDMAARSKPTIAILDQFMIAERGVVSTMVILILIITAFLAYYPVPLPSNLILHSAVFAIYFLSKSALILYRNLTGASADRFISLGVMGLAGLCLCIWIAGLRQAGEQTAIIVGHRWDPSEAERLIAQLKGMNSALARISRE
ncbi:MAG: hypothetical protein JST93_31990 [Acidobacteria bacterium]|nr:hypothetical protein [Acidobacteriota bacterium]